MRDYSNIPVLNWDGEISAKKAMAQVHHAEPVILQMPENFTADIDITACGCKSGNALIKHIDCHAADTLRALAATNALPELAELAEVAHEAGQVVDIDADKHRIVIHD